MMKTMFVAMPFGRFDLGSYVPPSLAQTDTAPSSGSSGDVLNVSKDIETLLKQVPPEVLGTYQTEYKRCQDLLDKGGLVGLTAGGKCLYDLYNTLSEAIKHPQAQKPSPIPFLAPQSSFPVVPVLLLLVGGGALIYGMTKLG